MVTEHKAELIFIKGPQNGERVVLVYPKTLCGRSMQAGVHIQEHSVSREQMLFELMGQDWAVQNLVKSSRIKVNGKKYKAGKQILLDSGDIIEIGVETRILFVAPGADPDEVLSAYRTNNPSEPVPIQIPGLGQSPEAFPQPQDMGQMPGQAPGQTPPVPGQMPGQTLPVPGQMPGQTPPPVPGQMSGLSTVSPQLPEGFAPSSPLSPGISEPPKVEMQPGWIGPGTPDPGPAPGSLGELEDPDKDKEHLSPDDIEAMERKSKIKKYALMGGVYGGIMIMVFVGLWMFKSSQPVPVKKGLLKKLDRDDIRRMLTSPIKMPADRVKAKDSISLARQYFRLRDSGPVNLYLCVVNFRLYLAYSQGAVFMSNDERAYETAWKELLDRIDELCSNIYAHIYSKQWEMARDCVNQLLEMIPPYECKEDPEVDKMIHRFLDWSSYIARMIEQEAGGE